MFKFCSIAMYFMHHVFCLKSASGLFVHVIACHFTVILYFLWWKLTIDMFTQLGLCSPKIFYYLQALIASSFAKKDYSAVKEMTYSALKVAYSCTSLHNV